MIMGGIAWESRGWAFYGDEDGKAGKALGEEDEQSDEPGNKPERNEEPITPLLPGEWEGV